jgi:DNA-binding transcriptional LysR family regulator
MLHARLLTYVDEVARAGSIRKAAQRLNIASSAINRQILALEREIGVPIFERMSRRLRLTSSGEVLIDHVRRTLKERDRVMARIDELKGLRSGIVTIATLEALTGDVLALVVSAFLRDHPRTKIDVRAMSSETIVTAVSVGEVDLGFGFDLPLHPGLRVHAAVDCRLGAVVKPDHPLAARSSVRLADCLDYPLVLAARRLPMREIFDRVFERAVVPVEPVVETNSIDLMKRLVMLDNKVTFLTRIDVEEDRRRGSLVFLPFLDRDFGSQSLAIVQRAKAALDPAPRLFAEELREMLQKIGDPSG